MSDEFGDKYKWTEEDNKIGQAEQHISEILTVNGGDMNSDAIDSILQDLGKSFNATLDINITPFGDGTYGVTIEKESSEAQ